MESGMEIPGTKFRMARQISTGGHGLVLLVDNPDLEQQYVMKLLLPQFIDRKDLVKMMQDEAKILARLKHPNIVTVMDSGMTAEARPRPYIVMENLRGKTLAETLHCSPRGIGLQASLKIGIHVCDALAHAHAQGFIHRDVKPDNIFVHTPFKDILETKLIDFGIAHIDYGIARIANGRVLTGKGIGTPQYCAPEQVTGKEISEATDLYALGLVLYEMLLGIGPFDGEITEKEFAYAHVHRLPPALPFGAVPERLDRLVMQLLEKSPGDRPKNAIAVSRVLREILAEAEMDHAAKKAAAEGVVPIPMNATHDTDPTPVEILCNVSHDAGADANDTDPGTPEARRNAAVLAAMSTQRSTGTSRVTTLNMMMHVPPMKHVAAAPPGSSRIPTAPLDRLARTPTPVPELEAELEAKLRAPKPLPAAGNRVTVRSTSTAPAAWAATNSPATARLPNAKKPSARVIAVCCAVAVAGFATALGLNYVRHTDRYKAVVTAAFQRSTPEPSAAAARPTLEPSAAAARKELAVEAAPVITPKELAVAVPIKSGPPADRNALAPKRKSVSAPISAPTHSAARRSAIDFLEPDPGFQKPAPKPASSTPKPKELPSNKIDRDYRL